ncbi:MAG: hypothetical protein PQJ61_11635 [Spirochaetales bacterium]|uniref:Uncharacterized protein n=1 Tax=Candidatus Thalassospirochaeta sargassi TaxID=3119039 RepID=A0AAJ1MP91_9SPIO|nr:hypothetical protein [Spirochaetales bacterium]
MRDKAVYILTFVFLTSIISGCNSLGKPEEASTQAQAEQASTESEKVLPYGWSHETEITNPGSRSEGSISRLFFRYTEVPPVFDIIIIDGFVFTYQPMIQLWDASGYIETGSSIAPASVEDALTRNELKRGWYLSPNDEIKTCTPAEWIWVSAGGIEARISPDYLDDFISFYEFKPITGQIPFK